MTKTIIFANRNIKEMLRNPFSWVFGMAMPIGILLIMQIIIKSVGEEAAKQVQMFTVDYFTGGVVVFGASFLTMFCVLLMSRDRSESFLTRLYASPMRPMDYILGYAIAALPLMAMQVALTFSVAMAFGLTLSWNIIPAIIFSAFSSLMFIALGILFGSCLSEKSGPAVCSAVVQVAALLSGMWFSLDMIGGGFAIFCRILPFAHAYDIIRFSLMGQYDKIWLPIIVVIAYTALFSVLAALAFRRTMRNN